jgi:hypothetical protein
LDDEDDDEDDEGAVRKIKFDDVLRVLEPEEIDSIDGKKLKADIAFLEGKLSSPLLSLSASSSNPVVSSRRTAREEHCRPRCTPRVPST